jgi:hypothetical protein
MKTGAKILIGAVSASRPDSNRHSGFAPLQIGGSDISTQSAVGRPSINSGPAHRSRCMATAATPRGLQV